MFGFGTRPFERTFFASQNAGYVIRAPPSPSDSEVFDSEGTGATEKKKQAKANEMRQSKSTLELIHCTESKTLDLHTHT